MKHNLNRLELTNAIWNAFENVEYPGDYCIASRSEFYSEIYEGFQIEKFLRGRKNTSLSWNEINKYEYDISAILGFLSLKGYHYYIPSFMVMCLYDYNDMDVVFDSVLYRLIIPTIDSQDYEFLMKRFQERVQILDHKQCMIVQYFLEYIKNEPYNDFFDVKKIDYSLDVFWNKFKY